MSSLYLRGKKSVWITFYERGVRKRFAIGIELDGVVRRNGAVQFPKFVLEYQMEFDRRRKLFASETPDTTSITKDLTIRELHALYIKAFSNERAYVTQRGYLLAVKNLESFIGKDVKISSITDDSMMGWRNWMIGDFGRTNASSRLRSMHALLNWAVDKGYLIRNPIRKDAKINLPDGEIRVYSDLQLGVLFRDMKPDLANQLRGILLTGMRSDEACNMTWDDINFDLKTFKIHNTKKKRIDILPMDVDLAEFFASLSHCYAPYVFAQRRSWPVLWQLHQHIARLKVEDVTGKYAWSESLTVHDLRRTCISLWVRKGMDQLTVKKLARHGSIATTLKYYTVFNLDAMREIMELNRLRPDLSDEQKKAGSLRLVSST